MGSNITITGNQTADWNAIQQEKQQIQNQAGKSGNVSAQQIADLKQNVDNYQAKYGTSADTTSMNNSLTDLSNIIAENKTDGSNNKKWEQDMVALTNDWSKAQGTGGANTSSAQGYIDDYNATVAPAAGQPATASTMSGLENYIQAHGSSLPAAFIANANLMETNYRDKGTLPSATDMEGLNSLLQGGATDSTAALDGVTGQGPGTAFKNASASVAASLPANISALQSGANAQQVNYIADATPPVYVSSSNGSPTTYTMYNKDGSQIDPPNMQGPVAVGMGNGSWLALPADGGMEKAWNTSDPMSVQGLKVAYDLHGASNNKGSDGNATLITRTDPGYPKL